MECGQKHLWILGLISVATCGTSSSGPIEVDTVNNDQPIIIGAEPDTVAIVGTGFDPIVVRNVGCGAQEFVVDDQFQVELSADTGYPTGSWVVWGEVAWISHGELQVTPGQPLEAGDYFVKIISPAGAESIWEDVLVVKAEFTDTDTDTSTETDSGRDSDIDTNTETDTDTNTDTATDTGTGFDTEYTTVTIQENEEGFCFTEGRVDSAHAGYTGTGYTNTDNILGTGTEWAVVAGTTGTFHFVWRYANMDAASRLSQVHVDGIPVPGIVDFPSTFAWTTWTTTSTDVNLDAGAHIIRLEGTTSRALANLDYVTISGPGIARGTCPLDTNSNTDSDTGNVTD